jgi:hypothetical protein
MDDKIYLVKACFSYNIEMLQCKPIITTRAFNMAANNKAPTRKYMAGDIRHLINDAIQSELEILPSTLAQIKDPVQRLNFLTKLMPFVCAPIKQVAVLTARRETGEDKDLFE